MGNYCSTGKKKDADNASTKSDDSQYTLNEKNKKNKNLKEAPLADPEPISDVSAQNTNVGSPNPTENDNNQHQIATVVTPEVPVVLKTYPKHLQPLLGKTVADQQVQKEKKIVLYCLSAQNDPAINSTLSSIYKNLRGYSASRGFELVLSNLHNSGATNLYLYDESKWLAGPLEAQGSDHALSANCIAEITRQSGRAYLIPLLSLGSSLGTPLVPLTIESQDFGAALATAQQSDRGDGKQLLEKWYALDDKAQPACYRLRATVDGESLEARAAELKQLLRLFVEIFTKDLKNSYLTTVVEQEINNTILMSQELARRCVWLKTANPSDTEDASDALVEENTRRMNCLVAELKKILNDKNVLKVDNGQLSNFAGALENNVKSHVDMIIEEHGLKATLPNCTNGIRKQLYGELEAVAKLSQIFGQNCPTSNVFGQIKKYIQNSSQHPLVIHGPSGSGKTVLMAKLAQSIHDWLPDCCFALRYGGLTHCSQDIPSILESIVHQIGHIQSKDIPIHSHTTKAYGDSLKALIQDSEQPIVIVVDSLEVVMTRGATDLDWIPVDLPANIKLIVTVTDTDEGTRILEDLKGRISAAENILHLTPFSEDQWKEVITMGTIHLPDGWLDVREKTPIHAKILCWRAWLGVPSTEDTSIHGLDATFDALEQKLTKDIVAQLFALIIVRPFGVTESEMIDQMSELGVVKDLETATQLWLHFCWIVGPLLMHTSSTYIMDKSIISVAKQRYASEISAAHKTTRSYYEAQPSEFSDAANKYVEQNFRKFSLLPRQAFHVDQARGFVHSPFLTDLAWISQKIRICGAGSLLSDLQLIDEKTRQGEAHLNVLGRMCERSYVGLNYDGHQFHSLLKSNLNKCASGGNSVTESWQGSLKEWQSLCLEEIPATEPEQEGEESVKYDKIVALKTDNGYFVVSISTARAELIVWDVVGCKKIRTLTKVPQPTDLCPVGDFGVAVLCGREIKVLDLNEGCFKVTLKGVMNQKMPYFGLHDAGHLVILSRNRMYVNLMNLESGDCVTTFKAGEDRFLNSLLVSGDGRILVCGDETQKPFPLLVWHLTQRKLLYDLRIPHHDFITSLSAITHEGSYVCVVAKELDEPSPNFIVVYDLQSGTLFKKWKPACDTVALAISQTQTCVIAGLEDSRILVWDLVTGNCKLKLLGHTAPVTRLQLDPTGKILLSGDMHNQDFSIRLWDLGTGNQLAVYTPPAKITTCEIMAEGRFIVLALENRNHLLTLELKPLNKPALENVETATYGKEENEGKVFEITGK